MVSRHVIWKIETFIEDTRNIIYRTTIPQSPSKQAPWDLTQFSQSPSAAPSYFPEPHQWSEISSLSKVILVWGKARSCRVPKLSWGGLSHLVDLMFHKKTAWDMMLEWAHCRDEVAHSCSLLNHLNSFHGGMFKLNAKSGADLMLYSLTHF